MQEPLHILKEYWGYDQFRPLQEDIIQSVLDGKDTLALLPTGGGKSICFQVPAIASGKLCLVVTPLIALMKDQVENLRRRQIKALAVYSGMSAREIDDNLNQCMNGNVQFLYLSPERLKTTMFLERLKSMDVGLIAIDEAHCISEWGHDFRPAYLEIAQLREQLTGVPVIALTATATPKAVEDIRAQLGFQADAAFFHKSFLRKNISYSCFNTEDKLKRLFEIINKVPGSAIVYVRSRKATKELAGLLQRNSITAEYYHAGLNLKERNHKQNLWLKGKSRVMVATNAFGMGIDKPDVRLVVHMDLPDSLEAYYQESGRAGRDGQTAYAVLLCNELDVDTLLKKVDLAYPEIAFIKRVYQALANYYKIAVGSSGGHSFDFDVSDFCSTYQLDFSTTYQALNRLQKEGFIQFSDPIDDRSKIAVNLEGRELYEFEIANQKYEPLLKLLLRMYGASVYDHIVPVVERDIAGNLRISQSELVRSLKELSARGVLYYQQAKDKTQLSFTTQRYDAAKLPLDVKHIAQRKDHDLEKAEEVIGYVRLKDRCRVQYIVEYFGETLKDPCGACDRCIEKKKSDRGAFDRKTIVAHINRELLNQPLKLNDLVDTFNQLERKYALETIRELIDAGDLTYAEGQLLMLGSKKSEE